MDLPYDYILYFYIYSFFGWLVESIYCSALEQKIINRGFLNGPICPVYGVGALVVILGLYPYKDNIVAVFLLSIILTSTVEYITGTILEKIFKTSWWDYSKHKFNIQGKVCLLNSILFGILSVIIIEIVHPSIVDIIDESNKNILYIILIFAIITTIIDLIITAKALNSLTVKVDMITNLMEDIKIINRKFKLYEEEEFIKKFKVSPEDILKKIKDSKYKYADLSMQYSIDDIYKKFKSIGKKAYIHRRIVKAFPKMKSVKSSKRDQHLQIIKKVLKDKIK